MQEPLKTYNGHFAPKVVLDLAFLDGLGRLFLDDGEELLDSHPGGLRYRLSCDVTDD